MKSQEVLRHYAAGERNFCNANLRGANFKGQDLSGADFSGADIRSTNFTNTTLHKTNFTKAQAGLQQHWMAVQLLIVIVLAGISGILQGFVGGLATTFFDGTTEGVIAGCVYLLMVTVIYVAISLHGFKVRAFGIILVSFAVSFAGPIAVAVAFAGAVAVADVVAVVVAGPIAATGVVAGAVAVVGAVVGAVIVAVAFALAVSGAGAGTFAVAFALAGAVSGAGAGLVFSLYIVWQVLKENKKFDIVRIFGLRLAALGGTSFCGADLTGVTFSQAHLNSTNFANSRQGKTIFTHVCWQGAEQLNRARLGNTILQDRRVRTLLTTPEKGYKQDLTDANLRGANLSGVTLEGAVLRRAILSSATLEKAILKDAILTEAQAINTNFTEACFTGATLEAWNIDSSTTLNNINCQYVFLREKPDGMGNRERRPHNPDKVFQPGDFEKFFKEMLDEVQILIRNGIDPIAFRAAFQHIMEANPDLTQNAIKSVGKQGGDVLLTLEVPEGTDKAKIERDWDSGYQAGLQAGREAERLESAPKFEKLAFLLAEKEVHIQNRNEVMTGNDQSKNINIQGNVSQGVVSLGDSNQVTNQLNQLGTSDVQTQLKDLLNQLKTAIKAEPSLSDDEKAEALEEVKEIATAGQTPQDGRAKKVAKRSLHVLKGMTLGLDETTQFVKTFRELLSAIALLFGL